MRKPKIGVLGFSDGEPEVHEELKGFVQKQLDLIVQGLEKSGKVDVIKGQSLVNSVKTAKAESLKMVAQNVDGTIFSYGVFSFPNFSVVAAKNGKGPYLLAANLNPDWPGMVAMLASGGALHHLGYEHVRVAGDIADPNVAEKYLMFARCAMVASSLNGATLNLAQNLNATGSTTTSSSTTSSAPAGTRRAWARPQARSRATSSSSCGRPSR